MKREQNQFRTSASKVLAVAAVTLIMALVLPPGAWAARRYKVLYRFTGGTDGSQPFAGLILDTSGNLYGTTPQGGAFGNGVVFKLTKNSDGSWTESVLHAFAGGTDGATPYAEVTFDTSGNLYGTTQYGGASSAGTVFQLAPNSDGTWTERVLYSFTGGSDGANPFSGVIFDGGGNLYGTTYYGGASGAGVVYKLTPNSDGTWIERVLHTFTGGLDGMIPSGTLVFDPMGRLYGVAQGVNGDYGNVFKLTLGANGKWSDQVLYVFQGDQDGAYPVGGVVLDTAGNLYGTTNAGFNTRGGAGQLFKLVRGMWPKYAYLFGGPPQDGGNSTAPVVFDAAGNLYGTAYDGWGIGCCGVVFEGIK